MSTCCFHKVAPAWLSNMGESSLSYTCLSEKHRSRFVVYLAHLICSGNIIHEKMKIERVLNTTKT